MREKITLFKFWAPWCPHCQKINRFYWKVERDLKDLVEFENIDTTSGDNVLAKRFNVTSVPTFILWVRGLNVLLDERTGEMTYDELKSWVEGVYDKAPMVIHEVFYGSGRKLNT